MPFQQFELDNYELNWTYISKLLFETKNLRSEKNQLMSAAVLKTLFGTFYELKFAETFSPIVFTWAPSMDEQLLHSYEINFKKCMLDVPREIESSPRVEFT